MFRSVVSHFRWSRLFALTAILLVGSPALSQRAEAATPTGTPALTIEVQNGLRFGSYEPGSMDNLHLSVRNTGTAEARHVVLSATFSGPPETTPQVLSVYSQYLGEVFPCAASGLSGTCTYPRLDAAGAMRSMQLSLSNLPLTLDCRNKTATVTLTASADGIPTLTKTLQLPISCPKTADVFVHDFQLSSPSVARGGTFTAHVAFGEVEGPLLVDRYETDPWLIFHLSLPGKLMRLAPTSAQAGRSGPQLWTNRCQPSVGANEIYCIVYRTIGTPPTTLDLPIVVSPATVNPDAGCGPVTLQATVNAYMPRSVPDPNPGDNTASATIQVTGCQQ